MPDLQQPHTREAGTGQAVICLHSNASHGGPGSWDATPAERQPAIANATVNVRRWAHALTTEPSPLSAFASLDIPVLLMTGARSTESAHGVARRLLCVLPKVDHVVFERLGHMGPITHPEPVNEAIDLFLQRHT